MNSSTQELPDIPTKNVFKGKCCQPKFTQNIKTGAQIQIKSSTHLPALPPSSASAAAPPSFACTAPLDKQPVISHGASKKKTMQELESKL